LIGMRERATQLGAMLHIGQRDGGGTVCVLTLRSALAYQVKRASWWS